MPTHAALAHIARADDDLELAAQDLNVVAVVLKHELSAMRDDCCLSEPHPADKSELHLGMHQASQHLRNLITGV